MSGNIAIIGAGQLGSRHLQALASVGNEWNIFIVDPSNEALQVALSRYAEVKQAKSPSVTSCRNINQLPDNIFFAVVATNSLARRHVTEELLSHTTLKYLLLEKFLFPSLEDYIIIDNLLKLKQVKAFVNTPRRMYGYYADLKKKLDQPFSIHVSGVSWGLACNIIHYLDLMIYLASDSMLSEIKLLTDGKLYDSKRKGYVEFCGSIMAHDQKGNIGNFDCYSYGVRPMIIQISDKNTSFLIKESGNSRILSITDAEGSMRIEESIIHVPRQSELTNQVLESLIHSGNCNLPSYQQSSSLHQKVLMCFLEEYRRLKNDQNLTLCPVT